MKRFLFLAYLLILSSTLFAESAKHIKVEAFSNVPKLKAGEETIIKVVATIDEHWYTYSFLDQTGPEGIGPTVSQLYVSPNESFDSLKNLFVPKPKTKMDQGFNFNIDYYKGTDEFFIPVKAKKDIDFSKDKIEAAFYIQLCDTARCLPPDEYKGIIKVSNFTFDDSVKANFINLNVSYDEFGGLIYKSNEVKKETTAKIEENKTESQTEIDTKKKEGVLSFLWFAMSAGALALLTPCVFPMVPITVSFFTKRAEKEKGKGLRDSSVYALGIITTFTALGFILALIFGATGIRDFASNGWVNLFIATIFIVFALNLFGAFEIQLPTGLLNKLNNKSQGSGIVSVLLMGLTFSLTSFTCTVPFVGSALISASGGEWFYPIVGMLGFSSVFAAPFFLLALFPSALKSLPKAGGWMNNVKVVMGFLEVAAAIKFISNADLVWAWGIMPREFFLAIWVACCLLIVFYILGSFRLPHDSPVNGISSTRIVFAIVFGAISIWLFNAMGGKALGELDAFLPPPDYASITGSVASAGPSTPGGEIKTSNDFTDWYKDYAQALEEAKKTNTPLFIDFTGFTCTNCRWMETKMFPLPDVQSRMGKFVKVKLFTDRNSEPYLSNKKMQETRYGSIELPLYVILTPNEELIGTKTFTRDQAEFIKFLDKGLSK